MNLKGTPVAISKAIREICEIIIDEEGKDNNKNKNGLNKKRWEQEKTLFNSN